MLALGPGDTDEGVLSELGSHDDVAARDVCANLAKADLLVGLHGCRWHCGQCGQRHRLRS